MADGRLYWALCGIVGLWLGFANNFVAIPFLVLLWPSSLVFLGLRAMSPFSAFRVGCVTSMAGGILVLYWLYMPVADVGQLPLPLAFCCAILVTATVSTLGGFFCLGAFLLAGCSGCFLAFMLALLWYLLEWSYAAVLGFPWLAISGALAQWPLPMQGADVLGGYALGACWVGIAILFFLSWPGFSGVKYSPRFGFGKLFCSLLLSCTLLGYGFEKLASDPEERMPDGEGSMSALFVEGNVDQNQKWEPRFQQATVDLYINLTEMALADKYVPDDAIVIWPETALPFFFESSRVLADEVRRMVREMRRPLLFGAPGLPGANDAAHGQGVYNRAFLLAPDGRIVDFYDKVHLVPFGEYLPEWLDIKFLKALLQGVGVYLPGSGTAPLCYDRLALGMLICYEGIFPWLAQERVSQGANILVDISNDGWFGRSPAARQHLYLTALRCLEQNRWLLRATNTGISSVVDNRGRLVFSGPDFQAGSHLVRARLENKKSVYNMLAPWLFPAGLFIFVLFFLFCRCRRNINLFKFRMAKHVSSK